jgi:hypothetical protein
MIFRDYRQGAITWVKSGHWSCSFGAVIACGAAGAYADAQYAAGEGIQVRTRLISQVTDAITSAYADDEHDEYASHCTRQEHSQN